MSLYLARADRAIVAADLSRAALALGAAAARRYRVDHVQFVESDLRRPGLRPGAFDVVYSSGVLHHTADPRRAFAMVAQLARPGGSSWSACTTQSRVFPFASAGVLHGARDSDSSRSIPCWANGGTNRHGARRGSAISINIPRSTDTRPPRSRRGFQRTRSNTSGHSRARSWNATPGISSRARSTTGPSSVGSLNWAGCGPWAAKVVSSLRSVDDDRDAAPRSRICAKPYG